MASFSIPTYVKTQFSLHLCLSSKDLTFNLCRKVRSTFGFQYGRNWVWVPGLPFCLEQWCRMLLQSPSCRQQISFLWNHSSDRRVCTRLSFRWYWLGWMGLWAVWSSGRCLWHGRGVGTRRSLRSILTQTVLWFCDLFKDLFMHVGDLCHEPVL